LASSYHNPQTARLLLQVVGSSNLTMDEQRPENQRVMVIQALIVKVMLLLNNRNYMFSSLEA